MPATLRVSYYPWITQHVPPQELHEQIERFTEAVARAYRDLGGSHFGRFAVLPPLDVAEQIQQILGGGADLALMNPLGYAFARRHSSHVKSIVVALRLIEGRVGDTYLAQIYTNRRSGISDLAGARGKTIAFGVPFSTSNFLIPAFELRQNGLHPLTAFSQVLFLGGHDKVARAVYDGRVQVGAGHDGVITDLAKQPGYGDADQVLSRIHPSQPIKSDPIAAAIGDQAERMRIRDALIAAGSSVEGQAALARFWGGVCGLGIVNEEAYDTLLAALDALALTEEDVLPNHTITSRAT